jgi:glycosyltransferase involved in cell wall biosynthesis
MRHSIIIPVYKNEQNIPRLLVALEDLNQKLASDLECVFVVDGSPDKSFEILKANLPSAKFQSQLLAHSRNFGSFPAIRSGLHAAKGIYLAVMAADLQEPPELILELFKALVDNECDVAIGTRNSRNDPLISRLTSSLFWKFYKKIILPEMPEGGVDIFGCNKVFCEQLLKLEESRSSLVALVFWLGFRRKFISYERQTRLEGKSAWTFVKKIEYMMDSIFAFTDLPIRLLTRVGMFGCIISILLGIIIILAKLTGNVTVPGYAATMLVVLFFGTLNLFGLGLVGTYAWRAYENTKKRPLAIVSLIQEFKGQPNETTN